MRVLGLEEVSLSAIHDISCARLLCTSRRGTSERRRRSLMAGWLRDSGHQTGYTPMPEHLICCGMTFWLLLLQSYREGNT